ASTLISYTKTHEGKSVTLDVVTPQGKTEKVTLTPRVKYPSNEGAMGVSIAQEIIYQKYAWYQAPIAGFKESVSELSQMVGMLGQIVQQLVIARQVPQG